MAGYKIQATKRVNLPDDIADGLWVAIQHPKLLDWDTLGKFVGMVPKGVQPGQTASLDPKIAKDVVTDVIKDWNLPPMEGGDGSILPLPSKDPSVWKKVPSTAIITAVLEELGSAYQKAQPDPNSSKGSDKPSGVGPSAAI